MSKKPFTPYEWPQGLYPLREWLKKQSVDVDALKSARQALYLARTLGRQGKAMPKRGEEIFPLLLKVQRTLCPVTQPSKQPKYEPREKWIPGTFGAASDVRHIDPSTYEVKS